MKNHLYAHLTSRHILNLALMFSLALPLPSLAASVALATSPLATSTTSTVMPNIMFMLDDSGSMDWDYMPDDAKNFSGKYGFNTNHCNGVYYNPTITYDPPVDSTGASYAAASFSAAWKNGFSTAAGTVNLNTGFTGGSGSGSSGASGYTGPAFYYTYSGTQTTGLQMDFHNTNSTFYKECNSAVGSTTAVDGTHAVNTLFNKVRLATTATTTITVTPPSGLGATITITAASSARVNSIQVSGVGEIMSGKSSTPSPTSSTSSTAVNIAAKINACTNGLTGTCAVTGFTATVGTGSNSNVITINGPAAGSTLTLNVSNGTMSYTLTPFPNPPATAVSSILVNGVDLLSGTPTASATSSNALATNVKNGITASGFSASVSGNVVTVTYTGAFPNLVSNYTPVIVTNPASGGMVLTTDAFPESTPAQLQNFANWYSYYSNRMLMMKTGVGQAFSTITDKYRVGFMTMNNNVSPDIVDIAPFNAAQRSSWYTKLYAAKPGNSTPLREALSHVGQLYAHKFGTYYTYTATITVNGSGLTGVDSITVAESGTPVETMAGSTNDTNSTTTLATYIAAQINLLDPSDYGASSTGNVVTITGPATALGLYPIVADDGGNMTFSTTQFVQNSITAQLNGILPADPIQYSCQQNFVILSTDGYWNGSTTYDLNSPALPVGNQDGAADRPMYDGATATKTTSQTYQSQTQLTQTTSQLQKKTTQLQSQSTQLQSQTSQLQSQPMILKKQISQLQQTPYTLQGTLSKVLMKCNHNTATCGTAPATGVANSNWSVVTSGSCTIGTNVQCAQISGLSGSSAVASSCNTAANISSSTGAIGTTTITITNVCSSYGCNGGNGASINSVTLNGNQILDAETNDNTSQNTVASRIAAGINNCTGGITGNCTVSGNSATSSNNVVTITGPNVSVAPVVNVSKGTATVTVNYTATGTATTYAVNNADSNGKIYSACTYSSGTTTGVTSCTAVSQSGTPNNTSVVSATDCNTVVITAYAGVSSCTATTTPSTLSGYTGTGYTTQCQTIPNGAATPVASCTATTPNSSGNFTSCNTVVTSPWANVSSCTATTTPVASGANTGNTTQCQYAIPGTTTVGWSTWVNAGSCTAAAQDTTNPYDMTATSGLATQCQTLCNGVAAASCPAYVGAASCTAHTLDGNGETISCPNPNPTVTGPTPVATCTGQTASSSNGYMGITCTTNTVQSPTLVASCTNQSASSSNNYVATACSTTTLSTTSNASGCTSGNSGPPSYIQTTCTGQAGGTADTLADVAMYYYQTDLRNSSLANCTGALGTDVCTDDVHISGADNNVKQHMTTYTVGLGTRGRMVYTSKDYMNDTSGDFFAVKKGLTTNLTATPPICSWQTAGSICNWPVPASGSINNIDDLWHAAVNGRGTYFSATDPAALSDGLSSALSGITARRGAAAAAATSTLNPVSGNNFAYVASYTTVKWTGNLEARTINTSSGVIDKTASWCVENISPDVCAAPSYLLASTSGSSTVNNCVTPNATVANCLSPGVFDAITNTCSVQIALSCTGTLPAMVGPGSDTRKIITADSTGTGLVDFYYANLTATQKAYFDANISGLSQWAGLTTTQQTAATGTTLVNYLRGQNGYEDRATNLFTNGSGVTVDNRIYRFRETVLGDALESQPSYIAGPTFSYADSGYTAFAAANANRPGTVYMGTNDGMLHAFDALTGVERWAYVPSVVIPNMWKLADANYSTQHVNFVNGGPIISDFYCTQDCGTTGGAPQWRTILAGGLNAGGREFYALDITDPTAPTLLWEFTPAQDADLGYSYGLPVVTKMANGTWVVLVTSGYDNGTLSGNPSNNNSPTGSGIGYLYVLDARTGAIIQKISTGVGTAATPSGLAKIAAWNNASSSNEASFVYGGDLLGNVWRFDINASGSPFLFATLKDPSGVAQPITTSPTLGLILNKRVIFVGTGKYLETADLTDHQVQTMYAIMDNATTTLNDPRSITAPSPNTLNLPGKMVKQTIVPNGSIRNIEDTVTPCSPCNKNPVDFNLDRGWYIDFPDSGERVNIDSKLVLGALLVPTIVPSNTVCSPGGYGWLNFFDFTDGWPITDGTGTGPTGTNTNVSVKYDATIVGMNILYIQGKPVVEVVTSDNPTPTVDSKVIINPGTSNFTGKRMQWRELIP